MLTVSITVGSESWLSVYSTILCFPIIFTVPAQFGFFSLLYLFYPLAGFVADVCCGRYKIVTGSVWIMLAGSTTLLTIGVVSFILKFSTIIPVFILPASLLLLLVGMSGFQANAIQYGLDQLQDAPSEYLSLFIYFYVWTGFVGQLLGETLLVFAISYIPIANEVTAGIMIAVLGLTILFFVVTLVLSCCKRRWFVVDPGSRNPYKLVYRVLRFAAKNKYPIQRSAFTYCEDELPSRIDFGKHKYGGPFTTEEVEDVKTFLSILCVLFAFGFAFTTKIAAYDLLPATLDLDSEPCNITLLSFFLKSGSITSLIVVICIPLYIFVYLPLFSNHIPGLLKRMKFGMVCFLLVVCCRFAGYTVAQFHHHNSTCVFSMERYYDNYTESSAEVYPMFVVQNIFTAFALFFIYPAIFEFICCQSPHAMKGLLFGVYFSIQGLYQLLGVGIMIPFYFWKPLFPSCGFGYYLVNVFIAIVGLVVYTVAARRYKYRDRQRGDYPNIHLFAEEYYGNHQDEPHYDFDPID